MLDAPSIVLCSKLCRHNVSDPISTTILTEKVNKNNLATRHSPGEGLVANRNAGRF